jgi:hypothetical protein
MQALDRSQPVLPMMPGMPQRQTPDYVRHGTTSLFAAFNIADGSVISALHRQHRAVEFRKFLIAIDKAVPADLDVHLICDNLAIHKTPAIRDWLVARQDSWQGPFLAVLIIEESDRHGETAGVPGRGEGPDRALDPGR